MLALAPRTVADFYGEYGDALQSLGIDFRFARPSPVEVEVSVPFAEDRQHASYDPDAARRWWQILRSTDRVMERFRSRFVGKASPAHFFWGSFDHATTRFSGRPAPTHPGGAPNCPDYVMVEAYSHECASCGVWPGGMGYDEPAFYAYAYPEPDGYARHPAAPAGARYDTTLREFVLPYESVRDAADPDAALLDFFQSTYEAAADLAHLGSRRARTSASGRAALRSRRMASMHRVNAACAWRTRSRGCTRRATRLPTGIRRRHRWRNAPGRRRGCFRS